MAYLPQGHVALWPQLDEFFNGIKKAFELVTQELDLTRKQRNAYEAQLALQANELSILRKSLQSPETQHIINCQHCYQEISHACTGLHTPAAVKSAQVATTSSSFEKSTRSGATPPTKQSNRGSTTRGRDLAGKPFTTVVGASATRRSAPPPAAAAAGSAGNGTGTKPGLSNPGRNSETRQETTSETSSRDRTPKDKGKPQPPAKIFSGSSAIIPTPDWSIEFSDKVKRVFDVNLVHTLKFGHDLRCLRFSPDGHSLATGCGDGATQIYDVKTGEMICILKEWTTKNVHVRCLCFSPDGRFLATGANDRRIRIWDLSRRRVRNSIKMKKGALNSIDFSWDSRFLVANTSEIVAIYHVRDGTLLRAFTSDFIVYSVGFSPDGQYIAAGNIVKILIWDVRTGESKVENGLHRHSEIINTVAFMPDGKLVSGSEDGLLKCWDRASMELDPNTKPKRDGAGNNMEISTFVGHRDAVDSVAISQDRQWIISGSADRTARIWDARSAACQCILQGHVERIRSVDFSPLGDYLATGSKDGQVRLWSCGPAV